MPSIDERTEMQQEKTRHLESLKTGEKYRFLCAFTEEQLRVLSVLWYGESEILKDIITYIRKALERLDAQDRVKVKELRKCMNVSVQLTVLYQEMVDMRHWYFTQIEFEKKLKEFEEKEIEKVPGPEEEPDLF